MAFSDLIAVIALLVSLMAAGMTFWFNRRQLALIDTQEQLNRRLLEKDDAEAVEARRADVGAKLIQLGSGKYRVKISNRGRAAARNIQIQFPDGNGLIPDQEIRDKLPIEVLEQFNSVDLTAVVLMQTPRKQTVLLKWVDNYSDSNEKISYLTL